MNNRDEGAAGTDHREVRLAFGLFALALMATWWILPQLTLSIRDEANYLGVAQFFLSEGSLDVTRSPELRDGLVPWITKKQGHAIPQHPLGLSLFVLPFLAIGGWKSAYLFSTLAYLVGGWFFLRLLERENVPVYWGALYFVFPPFLLYTRVFMADVPSMVLLLAALYYLRPPSSTSPERLASFLGGVLLGVALLIKSPNALFVLPLAASAIWRSLRVRDYTSGALAAMPVALAILCQLGLNYYFLRDPFSFSYDTTDLFRPAHAGVNLRFYLLAWTFVFPLLWLGVVEIVRRRRWLELITVMAGRLFYAVYTYVDRDASPWLGWVRGQRFLLPYAGVMLLYYAAFWSRIGPRRWVRRVSPVVLLVALILYGFAAKEQRARTVGLHEVRTQIYERTNENDTIIYNRDSCKFVHGIYGKRVYYRLERGEQFERILKSLPEETIRICVVETDHRYRKGIRYAETFATDGYRHGWVVTDSQEPTDDVILLWAERLDNQDSSGRY